MALFFGLKGVLNLTKRRKTPQNTTKAKEPCL